MRVLDIHQNLLDNQIKKLKSNKYDIKRNTKRPIIFRSDSKGRSLLPYTNHFNRLNLVFRGGAKITNDFLQKYTLDTISRASNPIIVLWFGTCELTVKRGKYIFISDNLDDKLEEIRLSYIKYKEKILSVNSGSKVIYLECPYQSLIMWNFGRGHPTPGIFNQDQKVLGIYTNKITWLKISNSLSKKRKGHKSI